MKKKIRARTYNSWTTYSIIQVLQNFVYAELLSIFSGRIE